ncbi:MAG TPA: hypothetical protein VGF18_02345, partial [Candidatus Tumulicola sp.]
MISADARDIRGVIRQLRNAAALRASGIVQDCFAVDSLDDAGLVDAVRTRVRHAVGSLKRTDPREKTEYEILWRCDVEGAPQKQVQSDLGLSRRAFYYHRRHAIDRLAGAFRNDSTSSASYAVVHVDEFELQMNRAAALAALGQLDGARDVAARAVELAATLERRVRVRARLAEFAVDAGGLGGMRAAAAHLDAELPAFRIESSGELRAAALDAESIAAIPRWRIDGIDPVPTMRRVARRARTTRSGEAAWVTSHARLLLAYSEVANVGGDPVEAARLLRDADEVLRSSPEPSPLLRARCAISDAAVSLGVEHPLSYAADRANRALELSSHYGFTPLALDASSLLAMTEIARERTSRALEIIRAVRGSASQLVKHEAAMFYFLTAARVFATAGSMREADEMLARAAESSHGFETLETAERFTRSFVRLAQGRTGDALRHASETVRRAEELGLNRMTGRAFAVRASAFAVLGRSRE